MRLPREKYTGTSKEVQDRQRERAQVMADRHPGILFSLASTNPLGVKQARKLGVPGAGYPKAIYNRKAEPIDNPEALAKVQQVVSRWSGVTGYVTYTTIQFSTNLPYTTIFGVIRHQFNKDPHSIRMSIDRLGQNTCVRFIRSDK